MSTLCQQFFMGVSLSFRARRSEANTRPGGVLGKEFNAASFESALNGRECRADRVTGLRFKIRKRAFPDVGFRGQLAARNI